MIDYFCKWLNEADAKQDAARLRKYFGDGLNGDSPPAPIQNWLQNHFLPNVQVWRPSQDVGSPPVHTYLTGWFGILALDYVDEVIMAQNCVQFVLNRDFDPLASPKNLVVLNNIGAVINDIGVSPIFAGSRYPIGGIA
jgi:hypothetical protein